MIEIYAVVPVDNASGHWCGMECVASPNSAPLTAPFEHIFAGDTGPTTVQIRTVLIDAQDMDAAIKCHEYVADILTEFPFLRGSDSHTDPDTGEEVSVPRLRAHRWV